MLEKISRKTIFKHRRLIIYEDSVKNKIGVISKYILFDKTHLEGVVVIAVDENGDYIMCKDYSYPVNKYLLQFCEGAIENGETPEFAAKRELLEELGLHTNQLRPIGKYLVNHRRSTAKMYVFIATSLSKGDQKLELDEYIKSVRMSRNQVVRLIKNGDIYQPNALAAWAIYSNIY